MRFGLSITPKAHSTKRKTLKSPENSGFQRTKPVHKKLHKTHKTGKGATEIIEGQNPERKKGVYPFRIGVLNGNTDNH